MPQPHSTRPATQKEIQDARPKARDFERPKPSNETSTARGPYTATPSTNAEQARQELRFLEVYGDPHDAIQRDEMRHLRAAANRGGDSP